MVLLSNDEKKFYIRLIEAIIFYEGKPVDVAYCSKLCQIDEDTCLQLMLELKKELQFSNRGILLEQQNESFFYIINPDIKDSFKKLYKITDYKPKLTEPLKEVLSIIAFKQPITKTEIEAIRGVDSTYSLKRLIELELVEVKGKKDVPGKPCLYGTTIKFLQLFNLNSLDQLPKPEELLGEVNFFGEKM